MKAAGIAWAMVRLGIGIMLCVGGPMNRFAAAQTSTAQKPAVAGAADVFDDLQRSAKQYMFQLSAGGGAKRGEEIYYFKCWICHNEYTIKAGTPAPPLKDLYKRATLNAGDPVNDQTVGEKIRNGGPLMPAYRHTLSDKDLADLVAYLREGTCCFEENPPSNPWYRATEQSKMQFQFRNNLRGGPRGVVRDTEGTALEGIMVQLIAQENSVRTTVYSNEEGQYEFPKLPTGTYTLRISLPLEFQPYRKEAVRIDGAPKLDDIVLKRVTAAELLPPTAAIAGQLSGAEWLLNMAGTQQEKRMFVANCNWCHSYQLVFRSRYDEDGWRLIVERMSHYAGSPLIIHSPRGRMKPDEEDMLVKWLARVRGPGAKDTPFKTFPAATGLATRVVVTEYELPQLWLATHDVNGDSQGNLWWSPHRSPFIGRLDPRTGYSKEFHIPDTPGALPGTHWIQVTKNDVIWCSQNWAHKLTQFDPKTGEMRQITPPLRHDNEGNPLAPNVPMGGNWWVADDGFIWKARDHLVTKTDPLTGKYVATYPIKNVDGTYGSAISLDQNYFAGGAWGEDWVVALDIKKGEVIELKTRTTNQGPGRGRFDPQGNGWFGGKANALVKIDPKARRLKEYFAPGEYVSFYEANPDKNGEVWGGGVQDGRYYRYNPKLDRWIVYVLPEPYSHNRKSWIDSSTDPVSLWYVDHNGYLVHIQPLE